MLTRHCGSIHTGSRGADRNSVTLVALGNKVYGYTRDENFADAAAQRLNCQLKRLKEGVFCFAFDMPEKEVEEKLKTIS